MKPAVRFAPKDQPVETARLLVADLAILALAGVWRGGVYVVRQSYDYAKKCHWIP